MSSLYQIVAIDEGSCIGCTKCINVCPVDAILGANKQTHAVLTEFCIGCELCLPACPVNCIQIIPALDPVDTKQRASVAKARVQVRNKRLNKELSEKQQADSQVLATNMKLEIAASLARTQQKRKPFVWGQDE